MPAFYDQGFAVRTPSWHGLEDLLDDYPGREEGMRLAGHDFEVIERGALVERPAPNWDFMSSMVQEPIAGWKVLENSKTGGVLNVVKSSYEVIQNSTGWDVIDALVGEGAKYETGMTLKDGAVCLVTAWLDEPVQITGDDSDTLPYAVVRWTHDGSGSLVCRSTSVRVVCANTDAASEAEARRNRTEFVFRHTKNVASRIEDAKMAIKGIRDDFEVYRQQSEELAQIAISDAQRELFIELFIPTPHVALTSERVVANIEKARQSVRTLFEGPTIPEAHTNTAYGLRLAGVEYLDHLRGYRSTDTLVGRQLLRPEPAKAKINTLIREVVKAT